LVLEDILLHSLRRFAPSSLILKGFKPLLVIENGSLPDLAFCEPQPLCYLTLCNLFKMHSLNAF
jgi:hypothetical protein